MPSWGGAETVMIDWVGEDDGGGWVGGQLGIHQRWRIWLDNCVEGGSAESLTWSMANNHLIFSLNGAMLLSSYVCQFLKISSKLDEEDNDEIIDIGSQNL